MKIIYLTGYRYPSSLEEPLTSGDLRYSFTLSRNLATLGHDVHVITRGEGEDKPYATLDGVHIHRYRSEFSKLFSTSFDISFRRYRLFRKLKADADLIICNSPLSLEHLGKLTPPVIYIASGLEDTKNYSLSIKEILGYLAIKILRDPLKKLTWKRSKFVNTTAWHEDDTLLKWGVPKTKVATISSSVDTKRYYPRNKSKLKKKLAGNKHLLLSVSRFTPAKGLLETIEAFNRPDRDDVQFVIIGVHHSHSDDYFEKVTKAIHDSPRRSQIKLLENIAESDLPLYYSAADITTVFSVGYDPLPTVIIESMACGTPVVSTYYKTREQFIDNEKTGLFVKERDIDDWVAKTAKLLDSEDLRSKISKRGLDKVSEQFDSKKIAEKYIEMGEQ